MNKYEKMLQELKTEIDESYAQYCEKWENLHNQANAACHKYNDQIHAINSLRQSLQDVINDLCKFLKRFGNIGVNISAFDYVTEDSRFVHQNMASGSVNSAPNSGGGSSAFMKTTTLAVAVVSRVALPAMWIGDAWSKRARSKKEYLAMEVSFEEQKVVWEKSLSDQKDEATFYSTASEIANLYRALIATVRMAIRDTILPELTGIDAFLVADAIKNSIISDMDPQNAEILSIDSYQGTAYDMHYIFIRNAFDYYTTIVKFFTEPVLTNIVADNKVTDAERRAFNMKVSQIKQQTKKLEASAVFGG